MDLSIDPFELVGFSKVGALSPGDMRVYDNRSQGFIPGEGCGLLVLMREEDALAQGRPIFGRICGWGISSDGSGGISRPEAEGQAMAIRRAYRRAGYGIESVSYFEGHGTGTLVGDATELRALSSVRSETADIGESPKESAQGAALGSIKANIGHTKAAAGVAGLIKAIQAVRHRILPPHTGFDDPHEELTGSSLRLLRGPQLWPETGPARASVSAMGFGGINVHVTLEGPKADRPPTLTAREERLGRSPQDCELFLLDGTSAEALRQRVMALRERAPGLSRAELGDLAASLEGQLADGKLRAAVAAGSPAELSARLGLLSELLDTGKTETIDPERGLFLGSRGGAPAIGLLFTGQGSPANLQGGIWARRFSSVSELYGRVPWSEDADGIATEVAQPAIVTASLAGLQLLDRLGLAARVAVGHSLGELAALHWAGCLGEEDLLGLATARGKAMGASRSGGTMASLGASAERTETWLQGVKDVVIACHNGPERTVVSGPRVGVGEVVAKATAAGVKVEQLRVSHAFHSPLVEESAEEVGRAAEAIDFQAPRSKVLSTVTGEALDGQSDLPDLLRRQVRSPVLFDRALAAAEEIDLWIEVGPGRALAGMARESVDCPVLALDAASSSLSGLFATVAAAYVLGAEVETHILFGDRFRRPFDLDRRPEFLINPCERAPLPTSDDLGALASALPAAHTEAPSAASAPSPTVSPQTVQGLGSSRSSLETLEGSEMTSGSALEVVRALVTERTALPSEAIQESDRLLSDLHLSSIVVSQLAGEASRRMGLAAPVSPTDYADATVGDVALALEDLKRLAQEGGATAPAKLPAGVDHWVRAFLVEEEPAGALRPQAARNGQPAAGSWRVFAPGGHPLAERLGPALEGSVPVSGLALLLPPGPEEEDLPLFLAAAAAHLEDPADQILVLQQGVGGDGSGGGGGFARTLFLETQAPVLLLDLPVEHPEAIGWIVGELRVNEAYGEIRYDAEGERWKPRLHPLAMAAEAAGEIGLGPEDVLLVTGGGKGIAAECALALAENTGCRLALFGRSLPEEDEALAANLERMSAQGLGVRYWSVDVGDALAVEQAVGAVRQELGAVRALLHGAGVNQPQRLADLELADFAATLAPKLRGLRHVLAAVDEEELSLVVTFGSVIARTGMPGEAHYALANEWLGREVAALAQRRPMCRAINLDWSVWSGVGMGERLGSVDSLAREGITPIPTEDGVAMLLELLRRRDLPSSLIVSGRFGKVPTLELATRELPLLRFLEDPKLHIPDVELVVDCELSRATDPYLGDHVYDGEALFPAVLGLEAMAQVARALGGQESLPIFEDLALERPVAVPEEGTTIRLAALRRSAETIEVTLRCANTGFQADHFHTLCRFPAEPSETAEAAQRDPRPDNLLASMEPRLNGAMAIRPEKDLYERFLFQDGRFRRLDAYRLLRAKECLAEISPDGHCQWFGGYLSPNLLLGDPGARDAALHGIQACVPHATVLPTGVDSLEVGFLDPEKRWRAVARERRREGRLFVYDLEIRDEEGKLGERWRGLRLRSVDERPSPETWPAELLTTFIERRLEEITPASAGLQVAIELGHAEDRRGRSDTALRHLLGEGAPLLRRPDGKRQAVGEQSISVAHASPLVLVVAGMGPVGCDLEPVQAREEAAWSDLLGSERLGLAELLATEAGEDRHTAATRVWTAAESLIKAGVGPSAPLTLAEARKDGWVLLRSGQLGVASYVARVSGLGDPLALAFLRSAEES